MLKNFLIAYALVALLFVGMMGFRGTKDSNRPFMVFNDMDDQYKVKFQDSSDLFADGVGSRRPIETTVPQGLVKAPGLAQEGKVAPEGYTQFSDYYHTGRFGDFWGDGMPIELELSDATMDAFLRRGQERYEVFCTVCHGSDGNAQSVVAQRGFAGIASIHQERLLPGNISDGYLYDVIANGKGLMGKYGDKLNVYDRWAVVAYLRALQKSQRTIYTEVKPEFDSAEQASVE
ncbi:MAG: cytochrome c [Verrucomicrobiota bacterium]